MFSKKELKIVILMVLALVVLLSVKYAGAETKLVNPAFDKVDIQRVHDDDAAVTCWVLYAPSDKAVRSDSYSISCLPNSVIKPKAVKDE